MSMHRNLFNQIDVDTSSDEDEGDVMDEDEEMWGDSDDELDYEERLLQRTILRNFLGRNKTKHRLSTKAERKVNERSFRVKRIEEHRSNANDELLGSIHDYYDKHVETGSSRFTSTKLSFSKGTRDKQ